MNIRRPVCTRRAKPGVGFSLDTIKRPFCKNIQDMSGWIVPDGRYDPYLQAWIIPNPGDVISVQSLHLMACAWFRLAIVSLVSGELIEFTATQIDVVDIPFVGMSVGFDQSTKDGKIGYAAGGPNAPEVDVIELAPKQKSFPPCAIISYEVDYEGKGELHLNYGDEDFSPDCSGQYGFTVIENVKCTVNANFNDHGWDSNMQTGSTTGLTADVYSDGGSGPFTIELWADAPGYNGAGMSESAECTFDSGC